MDTPGVDRLRAGLERLGSSAAELAALALLAAGALLIVGLLWLRTPGAAQSPGSAPETDGVVEEGLAVTADAVVVHVAGAVAAPGLYELEGGARVADAIAAAGGPADGALLDHVNLARAVSDGERLLVPDAALIDDDAARDGRRPDGRVDLNRASASDLEALPGIGPVTAQRIVEHREAHGPFREAHDLLDVTGIGERTYEALADLVGT